MQKVFLAAVIAATANSATVAVTVISATAVIAMTVAAAVASVIAVFEVFSTGWPEGRYVFLFQSPVKLGASFLLSRF